MGKTRADIKILPGASKGFFNVVASPHNGALPRDQIQSNLAIYSEKSGVAVSTSYIPTGDILTMLGVPGQIIKPLCCQPYTKSIDMSGLKDSTLRFKIHQESRRLGFTVY
jgi:hypothetical protein